MAMDFFGAFDNGRPRGEYLAVRARIRRAVDYEFGGRPLDPSAEAAILEAAGRVGDYTMSDAMRPAGDLALDPAHLAVAFAAEVDAIARDLLAFLSSPIVRLSGATEVRPEVAFLDIALTALWAISGAADGLDARCEDLRQELNQLERMLDQSGERGEVESWEPATEREVTSVVDLDGPGGRDVDRDSPD